MLIRRILAALLVCLLFAPIPSPASEATATASPAQQVRYFERDGVTYCETHQVVQQRVPETRLEERTETVYRSQSVTENKQLTRIYWTPVTEYRWEAFWVGRWNPFAEPYLAYRYVPQTRWEQKSDLVSVPVTTCRLVPETRTVRSPVTSYKTVQSEVITRTPLGSRSSSPTSTVDAVPAVARQVQIGGIRRLDSDPPRYGDTSGWHSATTLR